MRTRSKVLLEPFKQVRFGIYILAISLSFLLLCGLILANALVEQYRHVLNIFNVVEPQLRWSFMADDIFYTNLIRLIICFVIFGIVIISTVTKLTHRFYGPIVAINRLINELKKGNYSARVTLRRKDELQSIAKHLNELAERLEKHKHH